MRKFRLTDLFRRETVPALDPRVANRLDSDDREPLLLTDFVEPQRPAAPAAH